ncbi:cysteine hydrolase family protein [Chloroflexota bacterium]
MVTHLSINRANTAVILMDYQIRQLSLFPAEFQKEILRKANEVLAKARSEHILVIYVEVVRGERTPEMVIHPDITPNQAEIVLTKHRIGPFSTTNLDEVLRKQNIETLVIMGIQTGNSVLSAVRWAADIGYKLTVISDCCADQDDEVHRFLMERVLTRQASVITSQEFLEVIEIA